MQQNNENQKMGGGSTVSPINPKPFLNSLVGKRVVVKLKWGPRYRGLLIATDGWMNLQILNAEELMGTRSDRSQRTGTLGEIMIRYNNVLWIARDS